ASEGAYQAAPVVRPSQGTHLVLDAGFLPGSRALMIPETDDGRVLFAIPWHGKVLLGTTDVAVKNATHDPRPSSSEIEYLLRYAATYLQKQPSINDVRSCFAGLRPLVGARSGMTATSKLSREHEIYLGPTGMISVIGGKWTTYRHMGEELINHAERAAGLKRRGSRTGNLVLLGGGGASGIAAGDEHLAVYGTDAKLILEMSRPSAAAGAAAVTAPMGRLHARLPYGSAEVMWAVRQEMAMTVEDVLARRTRSLFLDARAALEAAPTVATILRAELNRDAEWEQRQLAEFRTLAGSYMPLF
ncbi:MAG: glycerol-3-phosphate dehydrogenase/oxidase, partial [Planctomycetota bacterium]